MSEQARKTISAMAEKITKLEAERGELAAELAELQTKWQQVTEGNNKLHVLWSSAIRERDALAAIVKQQKETIDLYSERTGWPERLGECEEKHFLEKALDLDISQAEAILAKRDAEVLRKAADEFESRAHIVVPQELRRLADELEKKQHGNET